jgi:hypothetical protein
MNLWTIAGVILLILALAGLKIWWSIKKGRKEKQALLLPYLEPEKAIVLPETESGDLLPEVDSGAETPQTEAEIPPEETKSPEASPSGAEPV